MKKRLELIKRNYKTELQKTLFVVIGFTGGLLISRGIKKATAERPNLKKVVDYGTPVLLSVTGIALSSGSEEKEKTRYIGYGLTASGVLELIRVLPIGEKLLSGTDEIPSQYLMEGFRGLSADETDLSEIAIQGTSVEAAEEQFTNLPDLGGNDLGFNPEQTADVHRNSFNGLAFNPQQTADVDMQGII